jgi:hypothetical protein
MCIIDSLTWDCHEDLYGFLIDRREFKQDGTKPNPLSDFCQKARCGGRKEKEKFMRITRYITFILLLTCCNYAEILSIKSYLDSLGTGYYVDPVFEELFLNVKEMPSSSFNTFSELSQLMPLRIERDKSLIKILPSVYQNPEEPKMYRASVFGEATEQAMHVLQSSNGWFSRLRLRWKRSRDQVIVYLECSKEFYLNQFHEDHQLLMNALGYSSTLEPRFTWKDWLSYQRDLLYTNHMGLLPGYQPYVNQYFAKERREGVLSDVGKSNEILKDEFEDLSD